MLQSELPGASVIYQHVIASIFLPGRSTGLQGRDCRVVAGKESTKVKFLKFERREHKQCQQ